MKRGIFNLDEDEVDLSGNVRTVPVGLASATRQPNTSASVAGCVAVELDTERDDRTDTCDGAEVAHQAISPPLRGASCEVIDEREYGQEVVEPKARTSRIPGNIANALPSRDCQELCVSGVI